MSKDLKMHMRKVKPIIRKGKFKGTYLDTDIRFDKYGDSRRWFSEEELANLNTFFFIMCDKLSVGNIVYLSIYITRIVYNLYPTFEAIKSMSNKYGYNKEIMEMNKNGYITVNQLANTNSFFMILCEKLSHGLIIDLSMEVTRIIYGMYPNYDAIRAMIKKYGYDKEIKVKIK